MKSVEYSEWEVIMNENGRWKGMNKNGRWKGRENE